MPDFVTALPLSAGVSRLENLIEIVRVNRFAGQGGALLQLALVSVGAVVAIWFVLRIGRQAADWLCRSPLVLFCHLCRAHRLPWGDWRLLWRVGRLYRLEHPATIFLDPDHLDPSRLFGALRVYEPRVTALREKLFAEFTACATENVSHAPPDLPPEMAAAEEPGAPLFPIA